MKKLVAIFLALATLTVPVSAQVVTTEAQFSAEVNDMEMTSDGSQQRYYIFTRPNQLDVTVANTGNVPILPTGTIRISNTFNRVIATTAFNPDEVILEPGEERVISTEVAADYSIGKYTTELDVVYGSSQELVAEKTFWMFPWVLTGLLLGGITFVAFLSYRLRNFYHKRLLKRHSLGEE